MKREIKFRVWATDQLEMYYNFHPGSVLAQIVFHHPPPVPDDPNSSIAVVRAASVVMQFTGATDANGVEIYEGDILEYFARNRKKEVRVVAAVVWKNGFILSNNATKMKDHFALYVVRLYKMKVIGNIHENPELLT